MTQFKVINRETKEVQIFNTEEILNFFRCEYDLLLLKRMESIE